MSEQVVFRAGNSNVVAIPTSISRGMKIKSGQKVVLEQVGPEELVIRKVSKKGAKLSPDQELKKWWKEFLVENAGVLDELALR